MMVGRPNEYAPTNQEYWEEHYSGEEDVAEAVNNAEALVQGLVTSGEYGIDFDQVPDSVLQNAADVVHKIYENGEDPRAAVAEVYDQGQDGSVVDAHSRERDWSDHPSGYKASALAHASHAFEVIMGEDEDDPLEVSEGHPMDNIGQNGVARR